MLESGGVVIKSIAFCNTNVYFSYRDISNNPQNLI